MRYCSQRQWIKIMFWSARVVLLQPLCKHNHDHLTLLVILYIYSYQFELASDLWWFRCILSLRHIAIHYSALLIRHLVLVVFHFIPRRGVSTGLLYLADIVLPPNIIHSSRVPRSWPVNSTLICLIRHHRGALFNLPQITCQSQASLCTSQISQFCDYFPLSSQRWQFVCSGTLWYWAVFWLHT